LLASSGYKSVQLEGKSKEILRNIPISLNFLISSLNSFSSGKIKCMKNCQKYLKEKLKK
jgi:hypothetical protein